MIRPEQIPTDDQRTVMAEGEKALDQYLLKHYRHKPLLVSHPNVTGMSIDLWRLIEDQYRRNGWDVVYKPSGMDGTPVGPYFCAPGAMDQESDA